MTFVTKEEAEVIKRKIPEVFITVTNRSKNSNAKGRYVEESARVLKLLTSLRRRRVEKRTARK